MRRLRKLVLFGISDDISRALHYCPAGIPHGVKRKTVRKADLSHPGRKDVLFSRKTLFKNGIEL